MMSLLVMVDREGAIPEMFDGAKGEGLLIEYGG